MVLNFESLSELGLSNFLTPNIYEIDQGLEIIYLT
jgi:hypothetical protein